MNLRKLALAATAAFVFAGSTVAFARPPLNPCQECRIAYNLCQSQGGWEAGLDCEGEFSRCLIAAGCPLE